MDKKVAIVRFPRGSFSQDYSYKTDMENLKEGDVLVVQANNSYAIALFQRYSKDENKIKQATKWVVQKVDVEAFENRLFLGEFE
ncbi:hypothetical protein phiCT453A_13 (endogenous virus) [Clostridium phage phiCT453A]|uniref:hypothetical protein n=1 Tax=Clostridium phage phiCT453A TaxID=1567012 RepID=UPI0005131A5F|nr:hypothetical protein [Clostridium tetani]YP_009216657.1 hypothetical protein phiCT453A_13 [Clostridium phage phiCT453A]AJA42503.1 hypothetical protein phiCT453A_13 [Clostridium phage phiCT453A]KGI42487.1 hypothetical protein KY55_10415 [Clostridium tetani]RXM58085.1 hypothetical protein DP133_07795 [Clostridium tetani]